MASMTGFGAFIVTAIQAAVTKKMLRVAGRC